MKVLYKDIKGYEGLYKISSDGKVFSIQKHQFKKTEISNNGYERVCLFRKGEGKHFLIHRLVADAFLLNPKGDKQVNHKDGNKLNNNAHNLEWCDARENMKHAYKNCLIHPKTTRVIQYTKDFEKVREWESVNEASKSLGLNHANIVTVCKQNTNRKYAGGFIWRYA